MGKREGGCVRERERERLGEGEVMAEILAGGKSP